MQTEFPYEFGRSCNFCETASRKDIVCKTRLYPNEVKRILVLAASYHLPDDRLSVNFSFLVEKKEKIRLRSKLSQPSKNTFQDAVSNRFETGIHTRESRY